MELETKKIIQSVLTQSVAPDLVLRREHAEAMSLNIEMNQHVIRNMTKAVGSDNPQEVIGGEKQVISADLGNLILQRLVPVILDAQNIDEDALVDKSNLQITNNGYIGFTRYKLNNNGLWFVSDYGKEARQTPNSFYLIVENEESTG